MPSVYLEDGGRLRCQAVLGYWQIFDGMPDTAGVIGRTYRTGEMTLVEDIGDSDEYLAAVVSVRAEICVPVRCGGRVVGVLNVESAVALDASAIAEVERCAPLLGGRLDEVGAIGPVSTAQRLARTAVHLASLGEPGDILRETLAAARALAGFEVGHARAAGRGRRPCRRACRGVVRRCAQGAQRAGPAAHRRVGGHGDLQLYRR
jgi:hypothetical protein